MQTNNVVSIKRPKAGTALERISQALALRKLQSLAKLKRGDQRKLAAERPPEVVYDGRKARLTVNSQMAALLAKDEL
jgi:hypothetical protein